MTWTGNNSASHEFGLDNSVDVRSVSPVSGISRAISEHINLKDHDVHKLRGLD